MGIPILILGESGSGKSTSIRTLDPKETFIINVLNKPLPFKKNRDLYIKESTEEQQCNLYAPPEENEAERILGIIRAISSKREDIKTIIIDDFQYIMANEFMRRSGERGYDKFTEIAKKTWLIIKEITNTRPDITCYILTHSTLDSDGSVKCKTIGKMLDEKITIAGMFTIVLNSIVTDDGYFFITKSNGIYKSKAPMDMFDKDIIENDLQFVNNKISEYYSEDINQ